MGSAHPTGRSLLGLGFKAQQRWAVPTLQGFKASGLSPPVEGVGGGKEVKFFSATSQL
ncbi:hypothetical protein [Gloeothece citriformis]|uniref:hypothetical protein n=1 Tax=Gloeothece citriformis TaxID=2546356 RepID=UPI0012FECF71|nr:hypothetical protein [Gloeothece citriformis]